MQELANYLEQKLKKSKNTDISFILNKYQIRHGDQENLKNVEKLNDTELNDLYDSLYREIIYYVLGQEHTKFSEKIKLLKEKANKLLAQK